MPQPIQLPILEAVHNNQYLFSDHYLNHLLPNDPRWAEALPAAEAFLAWLTKRYTQEEAHLPDYSEAQLEEHWIKPILTQLGHIYEPQAVVPGLQSNIQRPDYVFFPTEADRQAAVGSQNTADYAAHALAVGDAKKWGIPLGKKIRGGGASFEYQNPSFQIDTYLRSTNLPWGILTNGQKWRLVNRESSYRLTIYYEIDLPALLAEGEAGPLRYFTLFFRQATFKPDAQGHRFLDDALAASQAYAVALEGDVRENVYYALEKLLQGFLDLPANDLTMADLPVIFENSLILLYRLIFILYGESRGLLPMQNTLYRNQYSLHHLKKRFAELQQQGELPAPMSHLYWEKVRQLCQVINGDNADLNQYIKVPRYNGGLFDPRQHPFLVQKGVGDRALVEAINLLSLRRTETGQFEFVDYRTLGVRQLGSIYEGLLEYQPRMATSPMIAIRDNQSKAGRWLEKAKAPQTATILDERAAGETYLETDRGERKATGSYYTPQYIVEYIVDNTVGPLVETARQRVKARVNNAADSVATKKAEQTFIDEILSLKILDPAMGSGHFLVEATEYLARALATDPYITTEEESPTEEDLTVWKRRVVERCIYGVDKNPLAVELAKLSLWLTTVAAEKPFSFLDHHLKCGDALVGARIEDLGWSPPVIFPKKELKTLAELKAGQLNQFGYLLSQHLPTMMGKILEITQTESDSYDTVQAKEATDQALAEMKVPFEALANLWVSAYFGHHFTRNDYELEALNKLHQPAELLALPVVREAQRLAAEHRFFHWELAFPELFYDENGQSLADRAGFDVVVGNPPYGFIPEKQTQSIISQQYISISNFDLYAIFVECGVNLLSDKSFLGFIAPTSWQTGVAYENFRAFILRTCRIYRIINLPYDVFSDAYIDTGIFLVQRNIGNTIDFVASKAQVYEFDKRDNIQDKLSAQINYTEIDVRNWFTDDQKRFIINQGMLQLREHLSTMNIITLGEISDSTRGILANQTDLSHEKLNNQWKPYFDGDVYRYVLNSQLNWVKYGQNLREMPNNYDYFVGPRILLRRLISRQFRLMAAFAQDEFVNKKDLYNILITNKKYNNLFVLALLNSYLHSYLYIAQSTIASRDDYPQVTLSDLRQLPIPRINFTTPDIEREQLVAQGQMLYQSGESDALLVFSQARLDVEPAQTDVVHDLLAYLAGQMIDLNRQKQQQTENFWLDLEGVTDIDTFPKLRDKGKWESTLWKQAPCRPYVSADSRSTRSLVESLAWDETAYKAFVKLLAGNVTGMSGLVQIYRQHGPTFRQLEQTLTATDHLIDRLVYQLYGLTEEEIAIVEGTTDGEAES